MKLSILGTVLLTVSGQLVFAVPTTTTESSSSTSSSNYIPQHSPVFPAMAAPSDVVSSYNAGPYNTSATLPTYKLKGYPDPYNTPDVTHPEVKAAIAQINWDLVPNAPVRKQDKNGDFHPNTDGDKDPYCWWSDTNCVKPKINIPADLHSCAKKGDWGLSYDDGPFNLYHDKNAAKENPYAEPALYNFLAEHNQKANLFYIGGNVATYPAAAKRAFNDAVAELYWTLKTIKETTGVTPKCWRPPQGDVDDRIRSIAWQMGMQTILWDWDSNDWDMPAPGGGNLPPVTVDGYFKKWIASEQAGKETTGHIVLEHELNSMTVGMTEKWLPIIQKDFNVFPASACNDITQPYWETNMVYPLSTRPAKNSPEHVVPVASFTAAAVPKETTPASATVSKGPTSATDISIISTATSINLS